MAYIFDANLVRNFVMDKICQLLISLLQIIALVVSYWQGNLYIHLAHVHIAAAVNGHRRYVCYSIS